MNFMKDKIEIGLVGYGYWGKNLARNFAKEGVLKAICDFKAQNLKECASLYSELITTSSFAELLHQKIDAIVIASPSSLHYSMAKEALLKGFDVFVEKPLALSLEEGEELVELACKRQKILMVGHILRYHPAIKKLKELITKGELGQIYYIYSNRLNLGKVRTEENILYSFAPHDISVILYLLDEFPERVFAKGGNYLNQKIADVTITNLDFKNNIKAHIFVSWLHPYKEQKLVIIGNKAMAVFNDAEEHKLILYPHLVEWKGKDYAVLKREGKIINFPHEEPLKVECRHFIHCIKTRTQPFTDGKEGLNVLMILEKAMNCLEEKGNE